MPVYVMPVYLHVGPHRYGLVYVDGFIPWEGCNREALVKFDDRRILVSNWLNPEQMIQAIARELSRAWAHHWPSQPAVEAYAHGRFSMMVFYLLRDLAVHVVPNDVLKEDADLETEL